MIESFKFREITVDGKTYYNDIIIYSDHVQSEWRRSEGHKLTKKDIKKILTVKPDILMIGTGYGGLKVPVETEDYIKSMKIKLMVEETEKICKKFNELSKSNKITGLLIGPLNRYVW